MERKKGSVLIEVLFAIVLFLVGIIPITNFTLNSLSLNRRSSEIEEGARLATSVIDYIKSRGYDYISDNVIGISNDSFDEEYSIKYDGIEASYVVDTDKGTDFEDDFFGETFYNGSNGDADAVFLLESRGVDLEGAKVRVVMHKSDLFLEYNDENDSEYINPITNKQSDTVFGEGGLIEDQVVYGSVSLEYISEKDPSGKTKEYSQNFIMVPIENWN